MAPNPYVPSDGLDSVTEPQTNPHHRHDVYLLSAWTVVHMEVFTLGGKLISPPRDEPSFCWIWLRGKGMAKEADIASSNGKMTHPPLEASTDLSLGYLL